ncbi:MAG: GFA family protein [Hyphomicrobium sp.]|nr:GFA family protein [Hyphomicrobium sp.]
MTESRKHTGGCHCGAVRFEVNTGLEQTITCNCSICAKSGAILTFAPASEFTLLSGEDKLSDYQFNKKIIHHLFCKVCGIRSFGRGKNPDGSDAVAINVRCLDDVDVTALTPFAYDGKNA